ncbi:MAG: hypothetical protein ACRBDI_02400 [Alphaproteobacteria bacterium]
MRKTLMITVMASALCVGNAFAQGEAVNADDVLQKTVVAKEEALSPGNDSVGEGELVDPVIVGIEAAKAENADKAVLDKKTALAKKMHEIRPTRIQVDGAVKRASMMLPENERTSFVNVMNSMLNYNAIERISMDAMVETYTLKELEVMVDYYSKPEALTASVKMGYWAKAVQPEITRMVDKAIMRIKTGQ